MCTIIVSHNTAQNRSDNLLCYPPDNQLSSDAVYWQKGIQNHGMQNETKHAEKIWQIPRLFILHVSQIFILMSLLPCNQHQQMAE